MSSPQHATGMPAVRESALERDDFRENLYEWMQRTPWLLVSVAAHVFLFFALAAIPWEYLKDPPDQPVIIVAKRDDPLPIVDPPDERDPVTPVETPADPELMDSSIDETTEIVDSQLDLSDALEDLAPFDDTALVGLGPGFRSGGAKKYTKRVDGKAGRGTEAALRQGLDWLAAHQAPDGSWDADGFEAECGSIGSNICGGAGFSEHDVGVTGLALLAFLGAGSWSGQGEYADVIRRGLAWLGNRQDPDSGLIGEPTSREYLYDHAIATLAICEDYVFSHSPRMKRVARRAVDAILACRNPYGGWRYDSPAAGENDTSVTGWMAFALAAARDAGLEVDGDALAGTLSWLDEVTDSATGRVGYDSPQSSSARIQGVNDHFPREGAEAMTAVGLLCRIFLGQRPDRDPILGEHANLLLRALPRRVTDESGPDLYYWYYGTFAMFQMGAHRSTYWKRWEEALTPALLGGQRKDGDTRGSWDPDGPWGRIGGRVYSTALATMCLEVHYRYARLLGAR